MNNWWSLIHCLHWVILSHPWWLENILWKLCPRSRHRQKSSRLDRKGMEKNDDNVDVVYPGGINKVIANKYLYPLISAYILHYNVKYIKIIEVKKYAVLVVPSFRIPATAIINTCCGFHAGALFSVTWIWRLQSSKNTMHRTYWPFGTFHQFQSEIGAILVPYFMPMRFAERPKACTVIWESVFSTCHFWDVGFWWFPVF